MMKIKSAVGCEPLYRSDGELSDKIEWRRSSKGVTMVSQHRYTDEP